MSRKPEREGGPVAPPEPLAVPVVDAHCHLDLMEGEIVDNLAVARGVGIPTVVTVGVDVDTSRWQA
ncbi:MAG TPA: DNAase, partial [Mycobacteriales bacterium]